MYHVHVAHLSLLQARFLVPLHVYACTCSSNSAPSASRLRAAAMFRLRLTYIAAPMAAMRSRMTTTRPANHSIGESVHALPCSLLNNLWTCYLKSNVCISNTCLQFSEMSPNHGSLWIFLNSSNMFHSQTSTLCRSRTFLSASLASSNFGC